MDPDCHTFRDTLKKLAFVDRQPWMSAAEWWDFLQNPPRFFIRTDDATATRLWDLIKPKDAP